MAILGPAWDGNDGSCLNGAQEPQVDRFLEMSELTGGFYETLTKFDRDCTPRPLGPMMERVAAAAGAF